MTTSRLSPCIAELTGQDFQALRDFAIEAPWEWRQALQALCAAAEEQSDVEVVQTELDDTHAAVRDAVKEIKAAFERREGADEPIWVADCLKTLKAEVNSILETLTEAVKEDGPTAAEIVEHLVEHKR